MKRAIAYVFLIAGLCAGPVCSGQTMSLLNVQVTDLHSSYEIGQPIILTPVRTPKDDLHVRVFFGPVERLKRTRADADHCIPFYTTILWGVGHPGMIKLDPINTGELPVRRQRDRRTLATVTLVFEAGDQAEPGAFRLKPESVDAYFRYAIEIHLSPSSTQQNVEGQIANAVVIGMRNENPAVTPIAAPQDTSTREKLPCYDVNPHPEDTDSGVTMDAGPMLVATATPIGCGQTPLVMPAGLSGSGL